LHEKQGKRRKPEVGYRDVATASLPGVRKARATQSTLTRQTIENGRDSPCICRRVLPHDPQRSRCGGSGPVFQDIAISLSVESSVSFFPIIAMSAA
jgi:hypothetical protein